MRVLKRILAALVLFWHSLLRVTGIEIERQMRPAIRQSMRVQLAAKEVSECRARRAQHGCWVGFYVALTRCVSSNG